MDKKKKIYVSTAGAITGILLWAFISAGIITHDFNRSQLSGEKDKREAQVSGIILTETRDQQKYWEMYGEEGSYESSNDVAMMENVIGNFYKDNKVSMSFRSSRGTYNSVKNIIVLYENTFVVLKDGTTLSANVLKYSGSDKPITAKDNVQITRGNSFLATAQEVEISPDFDSFKIKGQTVSNIYEGK